MDKEPTNPELRRALDLPPLADEPAASPEPVAKSAGRPAVPLADTLEGQLALLKPKEAQFVRHVLADKTYAEAYRLTWAPTTDRAAQVGGSQVAARQGVAHALQLGRAAGAVQAVTGIQHDVKASFDELGKVYDAAMKAEQFTAAARAAELRAKLFRLIDGQPQQQAQAVTFVFKRFGEEVPGVVIEGEQKP